MGTSYDGVYFYGIVFDNEDGEGLPDSTQAAFELYDADDFDGWLDGYLRVAPYWADGRRVREYADYNADRAAKSIAMFGVEFDEGYLGYIDYSARYIHPKGAESSEHRYGAVPTYDAETVETWRIACERLASVLPGASTPGFYFGCSVG